MINRNRVTRQNLMIRATLFSSKIYLIISLLALRSPDRLSKVTI